MSDDEKKFGYSACYVDPERQGQKPCCLCAQRIHDDTLQIGKNIKAERYDGEDTIWFHSFCFFQNHMPSSILFIRGFHSLRWKDQLFIKEQMGIAPVLSLCDILNLSIEEEESTVDGQKSKKGENDGDDKRKRKRRDALYDDLYDDEHESTDSYDDEYDEDDEVESLISIEGLSETSSTSESDDQEVIVLDDDDGSEDDEQVKKPSKRKFKLESDDEKSENESAKKKLRSNGTNKQQIEKKLKIQSEKFWALRDRLRQDLDTDQIKYLLAANSQYVNPRDSKQQLLNALCECMYFGPFEKCIECKGQLKLEYVAYKCGRPLTWGRCPFETQSPKRKEFVVPHSFSGPKWLKKFRFVARKRVFEKTLTEIDAEIASISPPPLYKLAFATAGYFSNNSRSKKIRCAIERWGGTYVHSVDSSVFAVISNKTEFEAKSKLILRAEELKIYVVDEAICDELAKHPSIIRPVDIRALANKYVMSSPPQLADIESRINACKRSHDDANSSLDISLVVETSLDSSQKLIKMQLKEGGVVLPESGLQQTGHVLIDDSIKYSCSLGLIDVESDINSYYKMQIIESDDLNKWHLFRCWGRIATTVGHSTKNEYSLKDDAILKFTELFKKKTGNDWSRRNSPEKKPGKFYPIEIVHDQGDETITRKFLTKDFVSKSTLHESIQSLIYLLFDQEIMRKQMLEFNIDMDKMPLGKISTNQIEKAFSVLVQLSQLIGIESKSSRIIEESNKFYTLIPHNFGQNRPPLLNNFDLIRSKFEMLDNLKQIELAYNILGPNVSADDDADDLIDVYYNKLKCDIEVLDKNTNEFKFIVKYVKNTHGKTHTNWSLEIEDVFKVTRHGEQDKYDKFKPLRNKKLLWHGSHVTNFASILSQGLRIAPPEAPSSGYMFGKGVYFSDMVSKSANYCRPDESNASRLLLLCEVALGDMYERQDAEYITQLPKGKSSCKGVGRISPDPNCSLWTKDYEIPLGPPIEKEQRTSLHYNE